MRDARDERAEEWESRTRWRRGRGDPLAGDPGVPRGVARGGPALVRAAASEGLRPGLRARLRRPAGVTPDRKRPAYDAGPFHCVRAAPLRGAHLSRSSLPASLTGRSGIPFPSPTSFVQPSLEGGSRRAETRTRVQSGAGAGPTTISGPCASTRSSDTRPVLLVRVLPAEDRRGPAQPRARARRAEEGQSRLRLGHLRRGRLHARAHGRGHEVDQGGPRPGGDGAPVLRRRAGRPPAGDPRRDRRRRHRQRARAARRPAQGRDGLDPAPGGAGVLGRPDRADPRATTTTASARPASRRCIPRRPTSTTTCAT